MGKKTKKKSSVAQNVSSHKKAIWLPTNLIMIIGTALAIGAVHSQHLSLLFENDRFFSALSPLEREFSFRTEMGLYYSYYKTIIESPSAINGIKLLMFDNVTEFPDTINTLQRFNLYPEVILGVLYRSLKGFTENLKLKTESCFKIERGQGQTPVDTCTGITVPPYFYVNSVFLLNSLLPMAIFLLSYYLWGSFLSGIVSTLMFFYNHGEATRVMWTPPLRESFSMPFLYLQFLSLTLILRLRKPSNVHYILYSFTTLLFMLPWQFAQFALLTQVFCLSIVYSVNLIHPTKFILLILSLMVALFANIALQFGNVLLLSSYFAVCLPVCLLIVACRRLFYLFKWIPVISLFQVLGILFGTVLFKVMSAYLIGIKDDAHIGAILLSKFTDYQDFHTQLYTCSAEFDFISLSYFGKLSLTLLLPLVLFAAGKVLFQVILFVFKKESVSSDEKHESDEIESSSLYHVLQCMAFTFMAVLIMRLKLFLTPQMSILAGIIASRKAFKLSNKLRYWMIGFVIGIASISGLWNLNHQLNIIGEYNNPEMESLVLWINSNTPQNAVFAGSLPLMATIKLSTGRPIVIHPHYENAAIRERTLMVYTIYSQRSFEIVYSNLKTLGVQYVIIENPWCTSSNTYRPGCGFSEIYLKMFPEDEPNPRFCIEALNGNVPNFNKVYKNNRYSILHLMNHSSL